MFVKLETMRFTGKGTMEVHSSPFMLSYVYFEKEDKLVFLDLYIRIYNRLCLDKLEK